MARIVDNAVALRVMWILTTPFNKTDAFKLGLISADGDFLKKAVTKDEKNATSMLHRLCWRIKKFISAVPGGGTRIGSMVAAYALVRECEERGYNDPTTFQLQEIYGGRFHESVHESIIELAEALDEDAPANCAGAGVSTDTATKKPNRPYRRFAVTDETYSKFSKGKTKFTRWGKYLNLENESDQEIYQFARKNPNGIIVLQRPDGENRGIRYSKHGSGNWKNIQRKSRSKEVVSMVTEEFDMEVIDLDRTHN